MFISRQIEWVSSNNIIFDLISGGGFARKRIHEIIAMESQGKTSLLMNTCAELQRHGLSSIFFDAEQAFDPYYAEHTFGLKVDMDTFSLYQPMNYEEALEMYDAVMAEIENLSPDQRPVIVIFDSIAMLQPKALIEKTADDSAMPALHAKAMGTLMARTRMYAAKYNFAAVFTNQFRTTIKISAFQQAQTFYSGGVNEQYTTPGGLAPRYYSSIRVKLDYGGRDDDKTAEDFLTGEVGKAKTGKLVKVVNIKNKLYRPELMGVTHFVYPSTTNKGGWSKALDILELLKRRGRAFQRSTKFTYKGLDIPEWTCSGSAISCQEQFCNNPEVMADAERLIRSLCSQQSAVSDVLNVAQLGVDFSDKDVEGQETYDKHQEVIDLRNALGSSNDSEEPDMEPVQPMQTITL